MLTTMTNPGVRLDRLLLFHFLLITAWVILAAPLLSQNRTIEPLVLASLTITLSCISTLIGLKLEHGFSKVAYTLLFVSWMAVWAQQLFNL
ncbi:hypothetical protein [Shewanella piezotolerans]|uniref:hypothetical protein n=1 Tax=Shewanella piezotolerans TaxID=404011 RepID=UPI0002E44EE4|nr:hypothetical protein [Shewanella piezotolerans]